MSHAVVLASILNRGDDFRTSFKQLGGLQGLTDAPSMASAPPLVRSEIVSSFSGGSSGGLQRHGQEEHLYIC